MTQNEDSLDQPIPEEQEVDSLPLIDVGAEFRKERLRQGVTLEEVAAATGVRPSMLQALEDNNRNALPAEVFVRGFIKLFADFLGLDPAELLENYGTSSSPGYDDSDHVPLPDILKLKKAAKDRQPTFSPTIIGGVAVALLVAGVAVYFLNRSPAPPASLESTAVLSPATPSEPISVESSKGEKMLRVEGPETQRVVTERPADTTPPETPPEVVYSSEQPPMSSPVVSLNEQAEPVLSEPVEVTVDTVPLPTPDLVAVQQPQEKFVKTTSNKVGSTVTKPVRPAQPLQSASEPEDDQAPPTYVLELFFIEDTWLQVTIDGQSPREGIYRKGTRRTWTAGERIDLFLGNAGGVELTVNSQKLSKPGRSGKTKRLSFPRDLPTPRH